MSAVQVKSPNVKYDMLKTCVSKTFYLPCIYFLSLECFLRILRTYIGAKSIKCIYLLLSVTFSFH